MASAKQIAANRRNARKSTGPKSQNGKQRSAKNARTHGLAEPLALQAEYARLVDELADEIAGETPTALRRIYARAIAECEIELRRVIYVRVGLIEQARLAEWTRDEPEKNPLAEISQSDCLAVPATKEEEPPRDLYKNADGIRRLLPELAKLSRYERRAAAKRDRAVRRLIELPSAM